mmetsp:Transcript_7033/g.11853  ORF Transcript_7033/g.11853 Transcript_7033/m.11853 type:complete len:85 (-) Transcript_7033:193-447(-)
MVFGLSRSIVSPRSGYLPRGLPGIDDDDSCFFAFVLSRRMDAIASMIGRHIAFRNTKILSSPSSSYIVFILFCRQIGSIFDHRR